MTAWRRGAEGTTVRLATMLVGTFFRAVEVDGVDHVPRSGPLVMVANHQNGLVDGLVLIATSPRYPRFLGKSTLWKILPLRPFLSLAGVVPVYRRADTGGLGDGARAEQNRAALARAGGLLADGGTIGVFPEGVSHDLAALQDLRDGAARLALAAADAGVGVAVQPVGLVYDDKSRFRSRVLVRFGPARAVADRVDAYRHDPVGAQRGLTADIAADLRAVGPDYDSVAAAQRFVRLAAVATGGAGSSLHERDRLARGLALAADDPARRSAVEALDVALAHYEVALRRAGLDAAGLRAAELRAAASIDGRSGLAPAAHRSVLQTAATGGIAALTGVGIAVHAVPYAIIKVVGDLAPNRGMRATVKLLGSFGLYSLTYLVLAGLVARRHGIAAGLLALGAAPLSGWVALRTLDEAEERRVMARTMPIVGRRAGGADALTAQRLDMEAAVRSIVDRGTTVIS